MQFCQRVLFTPKPPSQLGTIDHHSRMSVIRGLVTSQSETIFLICISLQDKTFFAQTKASLQLTKQFMFLGPEMTSQLTLDRIICSLIFSKTTDRRNAFSGDISKVISIKKYSTTIQAEMTMQQRILFVSNTSLSSMLLVSCMLKTRFTISLRSLLVPSTFLLPP